MFVGCNSEIYLPVADKLNYGSENKKAIVSHCYVMNIEIYKPLQWSVGVFYIKSLMTR